eukprot:scaffold14477_cov164-Amphora_coffeaeformis.AAC.1
MPLLAPPLNVLDLLHESLPEGTDKSTAEEEILSYVAFLAAGLAEANEFDASVWKDVIEPYLEDSIVCDKETAEKFRQAVQNTFTDQDDADSYGGDEDGEEVCNLRFNLAYGGKILLHNTKLHLLRGRRYALVGQNGVGKTTLMNAINNGKIDGWPQELVTAYVDSGSNVDPNYEALIVIDHLVESTGRTKQECAEKLEELDFTEPMMEGNIGSLSGGWQMKLRLARASLDQQTILVVSHDTTFLENVCTDVIHYEQRDVWGPYRRLVHYKGKMSEFVKLQPQAKHYFELATTDALKFDFPEPGRLEGIRTSTQRFLEMEHVDFQYPGKDTNQLTDINLKLTLSSRVVV